MNQQNSWTMKSLLKSRTNPTKENIRIVLAFSKLTLMLLIKKSISKRTVMEKILSSIAKDLDLPTQKVTLWIMIALNQCFLGKLLIPWQKQSLRNAQPKLRNFNFRILNNRWWKTIKTVSKIRKTEKEEKGKTTILTNPFKKW